VLVLAVAAGALVYDAVLGPQAVVMRVNGLPVTRAEFQFQMQRAEAQTSSYFWRTYSANSSEKGFWERTYGDPGERPIDVLRETAKETAVRSKVLQALAVEHGVTDNVDFARIKTTMDEVNRQRRAAFEAGETLYGPVEFEFLTYWLQMESNFETQLQDKLEGGEVTVAEEQIRARYDAYYDEFHSTDNFTFAELFIPFLPAGQEPVGGVEITAEEAWERVNEAYAALTGGADFDAVCQDFMGDAPNEYTLYPTATPVGSTGLLLQYTAGLAEGSYSEPFENGFGFSILKMLQTGVAVDVSYEEAWQDLYNTLLVLNYRAYLDKLTQEADVKLADAVYSRVSL
jgi:hypothetical protein